jgi:lipopolysaccharide biosynthesis regulator YciM
VAAQLENSGEANFAVRQAHYLCEQARERHAQSDPAGAQALLLQALQVAPQSGRARILLGQLQLSQGQAVKALQTLQPLFDTQALTAPLAAASMAKAAPVAGQTQQVLATLRAHYDQAPGLDVLEAIVALEALSPDTAALARSRYIDHLKHQPSLIAASRWLAGETFTQEASHPPIQAALDLAAKPLARYRCAACGFEAKEHFWHCPGCQAWDSYPPRRVEEL